MLRKAYNFLPNHSIVLEEIKTLNEKIKHIVQINEHMLLMCLSLQEIEKEQKCLAMSRFPNSVEINLMSLTQFQQHTDDDDKVLCYYNSECFGSYMRYTLLDMSQNLGFLF